MKARRDGQMKAKRPAAARGTDERRRTPRQPARGAQRPSADAPPRRGRPRPTDTASRHAAPDQARSAEERQPGQGPREGTEGQGAQGRPAATEASGCWRGSRRSTSIHARWPRGCRSWCWSSDLSAWVSASRCGCRLTPPSGLTSWEAPGRRIRRCCSRRRPSSAMCSRRRPHPRLPNPPASSA